MPKPVKKKPVKKARTLKRPSSDPNLRAHQLMQEHMERAAGEDIAPPQGDPFRAMLSAHMARIGAKGGKASGAKRMENLSERKRKEIARKGAAARWDKRTP